MKSLRQRAIAGLIWTFAERFSMQLISFAVSVVLARLLLPAEFGLVAMVGVFIALADSLKDSGMTTSLIRTVNPGEDDYNTIFTLNILLSIVLYGLLFLLAPAIAWFFNEPVLVNLVRVMALRVPIHALAAVQYTRLTKDMKFREQALIQVPSLILGGGAGVLLAFAGWGVWSLVVQSLCQSLVATLQLWIKYPWNPTLKIKRDTAKNHFRFGYKLTLSGLLDRLYQQAYNLVIGKFFSSADLGFYTRAQSTQQLPINNLSGALNRVTLPLFSEIQHDTNRLRDLYKRLMQQVLFLIIPVMGLGILLGEELFRLVYSARWLPAVPYFQVLCLVGMLYPLHSYNLNVLQVKGRSDLFLKVEVIKKALGVFAIAGGLPFGILGLIWGQVIFSVLALYINTYHSGRLIGYPISSQAKDLSPVFLLSAASLGGGYFFDKMVIEPMLLSDIWVLLAVTAFVLVCYTGLAVAFRMTAWIHTKNLLFKQA
jgi:O-antigen/teichoic acid export membrane protein